MHLDGHDVGEAEVKVRRGLVAGHLPRDVVHLARVEPVPVVFWGLEGGEREKGKRVCV